MFRKLLKGFFIIVVVLVLLSTAGFVALKFYFSQEKIKTSLTRYTQQKFHRQVTFSSVSFNWIGLTLTDFALSESETFEQGTFLKADKLVAKVAVKPLFKKRIEIKTLQLDSAEINIIQQRDGNFNFTSFSQPTTEEDSSTTPPSSNAADDFVLLADEISLRNCRISYHDKTTNDTAALDQLNIAISHLDFAKPFQTHIDFIAHLAQQGKSDINVPLSLDGRFFFNQFDWAGAKAEVEDFSATYKTAHLKLKGTVSNFASPTVALNGTLGGVGSAVFVDFFPNVEAFSLPELSMRLEAAANLARHSAEISNISLSMQENSLSATGTAGWGETAQYNLHGNLQTNLSQLVQIAGGSTFQPTGNINGSFQLSTRSNSPYLGGTFTLQDVSLLYTPFTFEQVNGTVTLAGIEQISGALNGLLNQGNFTGNFKYKSSPAATDLALQLQLDKFILSQWPQQTKEKTSEPSQAQDTTNSISPTLNFQAQIEAGEISVPHFHCGGANLRTNLTGISDDMSNANGTVSFALQPGSITDLDEFITQNKLVKILLLPLAVIRKVSATLQLHLFPEEGNQGNIAFSQGEGSYTFTNGVMNVDKTVFRSSLTNLNGTGTVDFVKDNVNMKVNATLLTDAAPMVIKITGTPQNPKGKLDVTHTVGAVLGNLLNGKTEKSATTAVETVAENTASAAKQDVKDTITDTADALKELGRLFKKK